MSFADSIKVAIEALIANKLRACLTMLGIIIGVGSVIALMAVGQGSQKAIQDRVQGLGSNLVFVRPGSTSTGGVSQGQGTAQTLTFEDSQAIPGGVRNVVAVAPEFRAGVQIIGSGSNTFTRSMGVTADYPQVLNLSLASGEWFTDEDVSRSSRVVILGANVAQRIFGENDPVGSRIRFGILRRVISFTVIGVLTPKGGNSTQSQDDQVFVPLTTSQKQIQSAFGTRGGFSTVNQITVQATNKDAIAGIKTELDQLLRQRHKVVDPDFVIESQEDIQATIGEVSKTMTILLGAIAGISLVVGGIGIMNIMLVSVTERTREIGIRKAVGARKSDIMMQFLTEALTVTVAGGLIGIAMGLGLAQFLNGKDIAGLGSNIQTVVSWSSVVAAFIVSACIGIFFGMYPASRAAGLRPIEALRYE
jgi:putative ABC transport system permease protein